MLSEYNQKRDFSATSEPKGKLKRGKDKRFVIQYHQARAKHYDFRLEHNGVLLSWAIPKGLSLDPSDKRLAVMVEDHPVDYIGFEGIIPKGNYGAGTVEIFDKGSYTPIKDMDEGLKQGQIKIALNGDRLKGAWSLVRTKDENWLAIKIDDEFASPTPQPKRNTSLPFNICNVMLASPSSRLPNDNAWVAEIKYDGYRALSFVENGEVRLTSRNGLDYGKKFPSVINALSKIERDSFILDGEIVSFDGSGKSDFGLLQSNVKKGAQDFYYVVFDLLALDGEDLRPLPLKTRKSKLERLLFKADGRLIYSAHVDDLEKCLEFSKQNGLEGIVVKNGNSAYSGGRSREWLKIKNSLRQEFVIAGYATSQKNELISALVLGYYKDKELIYVGKVGTGLDEQSKAELNKKFQKITKKDCPFSSTPKIRNVVWLEPKLIAEIKFTELTKDGHLRQPSFLGLRADKKPQDVVLEKPL